jgi:hypothetical protein
MTLGTTMGGSSHKIAGIADAIIAQECRNFLTNVGYATYSNVACSEG